jgi:hypothetical protein
MPSQSEIETQNNNVYFGRPANFPSFHPSLEILPPKRKRIDQNYSPIVKRNIQTLNSTSGILSSNSGSQMDENLSTDRIIFSRNMPLGSYLHSISLIAMLRPLSSEEKIRPRLLPQKTRSSPKLTLV